MAKKLAALVGLLGFMVVAVGCGGSSNSSSKTTVASACRSSFQTYANALVANPNVSEDPYQLATLNACKSSVEWLLVAADFQGTGTNSLFPPKPIGGLSGVLSAFCGDAPAAPACP